MPHAQDREQDAFFSEIIRFPRALSRFLIQEIKISLIVNLAIIFWFYFDVADDLSTWMSCDRLLFLWLGTILVLNVIGVFTKITLLLHLRKVNQVRNIPQLREKLDRVVRTRIFKANSKISYMSCVVYLFSPIKLTIMVSNECSREFFLKELSLTGLFTLRMMYGLYRFMIIFHTGVSGRSSGLSSEEMELLKRCKFSKTKKNENYNQCPICVEEFIPKSRVTILPCEAEHVYHTECINLWLQKKGRCPICRADIREILLGEPKTT